MCYSVPSYHLQNLLFLLATLCKLWMYSYDPADYHCCWWLPPILINFIWDDQAIGLQQSLAMVGYIVPVSKLQIEKKPSAINSNADL